MKKKRIKAIVVVVAIMAMAFTQLASAAWTASKTFSIPSGSTFVHVDINNTRLSQTKATTSNNVVVQASSMTMWTDPWFQIHDIYRVPAGTLVAIEQTGTSYGAKTSILKGNVACAAVKSATFQAGTDTITFRFDAN